MSSEADRESGPEHNRVAPAECLTAAHTDWRQLSAIKLIANAALRLDDQLWDRTMMLRRQVFPATPRCVAVVLSSSVGRVSLGSLLPEAEVQFRGVDFTVITTKEAAELAPSGYCDIDALLVCLR
jgi:hypothetical protein